MDEKKMIIENLIKRSINRHINNHVRVPKDDNRCRMDILVDEAATEIMNHFTIDFKKIEQKK